MYRIDTLSFISPDVMLKLRDASAYDIEIVGDRVLLYGPLATPSTLPDMVDKLQAIKKQLLDNILTYRDERLPYSQGREMVAMAGQQLQRNIIWKVLTTIAVVLYVVLMFASLFSQH